MNIAAGSRLGPYEVLSPLGAGGMGEVWRARDTRLAREVAIKVLPAELSSDPTRLKRFEREAQAASSLTHPNIVTIFEVASADGASFIAMELVDGRTLRDVMAGSAMPLRKLLAIAPQIAEGLARAHEAGIVHRDLKPENVMVTKDGLVKILDFGLAKLVHPEQDSGQTESAMTVSAVTRPGLAMGTAGYMSPEQASGHPVDFRSDQFAFGSMLYEMATGRPAFKRPTTAQTLAAIIEEEPEAMPAVAPGTPAPLRWIVARCMAKEPENRYAATRDLVRDLSTLRDHVSELTSSSAIAIEEPRRRPRWRAIAVTAALLAALAGMLYLGRRLERAGMSEPTYRQLTFRGAGIGTARFAPDGQTIVFSSETEGKPPELLSMRLDSPEVRPLGLPPAHVLSISETGRMAVLLLRSFALYPRVGHVAFEQLLYRDPSLLDGTLAETSISGGPPSELLDDVAFADWAANGDIAVVRRAGGRLRVEFPIGKTVFDHEVIYLNHPRVSPGSGRLAFKDWGDLYWKDVGGGVRHPGPEESFEVAWSDPTGELWYTVSRTAQTELRAMNAAGRDRLVATLAGNYVLYDLARGRALLGRVVESTEVLGSFPNDSRVRDLSYFDANLAADLSSNGEWIVFRDAFRSPHAAEPGAAYLRKPDGSDPKPLRGGSFRLAPDGRYVLGEEEVKGWPPWTRFVLWPTGPGQPISPNMGTVGYDWIEGHAAFFPDGKRILFSGRNRDSKQEPRVWVLDLAGGPPRPITPDGTRRPVLVGDGRFALARAADFVWYLYPTDTSAAPRKASGIQPGEEPLQSSSPEGLVYVRGADELRPGETLMTTRVYRVDPWTGKRELWKEIPPANPRSGGMIPTILFSADGKTCVWTHMRYTTELVLAEGLK